MRRTKVWSLAQVPLLQGVSAEEVDALEARSEVVSLRRKATVWSPSAAAERVYFVRAGIVKVSKVTNEGRELTLAFYTRDDVFGEVAAFSAEPHETHAEAYEDVSLLGVSRDDLLRLLRAHPDVAIRLSRLISERRRRLENRIGGLLFRTAHARLASLFLDLVENFGVRDSRGIIINLKLTHKEMASLIGATRETVSFAILDLRRDGYILTEGKRVVVLKENDLRSLVNA